MEVKDDILTNIVQSLGKEELEAAVALENDKNFKILMKHLTNRALSLSFAASHQKDEVQSRWTQGRSQEIAVLAREIENARDTLNNINSSNKRVFIP